MKNSILCKIGNWGPLIVFGTSVYLLSDKGNMLYYYVVGLIFNAILNVFLKITIQQPRPSIDTDKFNILLKNYKEDIFKNGIPDIFGMPSGHTQSIVFSTVYVFLSLKERNILLFYMLLSLITMWQRVYCNHHTVFQVMVGTAIGSLFAYFVYKLARQNILGILRPRPDDNALL
jgi:membrane-associated phospholipid phosphatase